MVNILSVKQLNKVYGGKVPYQALKNIQFSVDEGEFVAIMGPSGSGKTTLLNMVSTIDKPTSGEVLINGDNPNRLSQNDLALFRRKHLGFIFQDFNLLDTLTVGENMIVPLVLEGGNVKEIQRRLVDVAKGLGIESILESRTFEVSGGQKQRTAIGRAIIHSPSLILADEPTGNLDSKSSRDVLEIMERLNQEHKATILVVTHDPIAASYCHRVLFIKDGQIYNEIYRGESKKQFYQKIVDVLALLGGDDRDLFTTRIE